MSGQYAGVPYQDEPLFTAGLPPRVVVPHSPDSLPSAAAAAEPGHVASPGKSTSIVQSPSGPAPPSRIHHSSTACSIDRPPMRIRRLAPSTAVVWIAHDVINPLQRVAE